MKRWAYSLLALCLLSSCKPEDKSIIDVSFHQAALHIASLTLTADSLRLDSVNTSNLPPASHGPDDTVQLSFLTRIGISPETLPTQIAKAHINVYGPDGALIQQVEMRNDGVAPDLTAGDSVFSASVNLSIPRKQIGTYSFAFSMLNTDGNSDARIKTIEVWNSGNHKPVLSGLDAPDTVQVPLPGFINAYIFSVHASDAEGLKDIAHVYTFVVDSTGNSGPLFDMFDDGSIAVNGDSVQNDGRFSRIFKLDSTNTRHYKNTFKFYGVDLSGAISDTISQVVYTE